MRKTDTTINLTVKFQTSHCYQLNQACFKAERVQSMEMDWHRPCLRCVNEKCNRQLTPGSHSVASHSDFHFQNIQIFKMNFVFKKKHEQAIILELYDIKHLTNYFLKFAEILSKNDHL